MKNNGLRFFIGVLAVAWGLIVSCAFAETASQNESVEPTSAPISIPAVAEPGSKADAREELQKLLDKTLGLATNELQRTSTFYPFLAGVAEDGSIELVGIPAKMERPDVKTAIKALKKAARQLAQKKRFRALAIYVDFVAERKDTAIKQAGIRVELEHRYPDAVSVFIPYFIHTDDRISLMTPQFQEVEPRYFDGKQQESKQQ